jgi:hypothetical protein
LQVVFHPSVGGGNQHTNLGTIGNLEIFHWGGLLLAM